MCLAKKGNEIKGMGWMEGGLDSPVVVYLYNSAYTLENGDKHARGG